MEKVNIEGNLEVCHFVVLPLGTYYLCSLIIMFSNDFTCKIIRLDQMTFGFFFLIN